MAGSILPAKNLNIFLNWIYYKDFFAQSKNPLIQ